MLYFKKSIKKNGVMLGLVAVLSGSIQETNASSQTSKFDVAASVVSSCTISTTNLNFGNYTLEVLNGVSEVTVTCTNGSAYSIGLNEGGGKAQSVYDRKMTDGANTLNYALYQDPKRTTNWGNTPQKDTVDGKGDGKAQVYKVYGQIAANQDSPIGYYTDTIIATVSF